MAGKPKEKQPNGVLSRLGDAFWWANDWAGVVLPILGCSIFIIFGLGICVDRVLYAFRTGDLISLNFLVPIVVSLAFILFPAFILGVMLVTSTELGNWLYPLWQELAKSIAESKIIPKPLFDKARQKPRLVIKTGPNHKGVVGTCLIGALPLFFGLYLCWVAFSAPEFDSPIMVAVMVFGLSLFSLGVYTVVSRHRVIFDRQRRKVMYRWNLLFWSREKEHDWDQCTAVDIGEILPYRNTPSWKNFGRRTTLMWSGDGSYDPMEPNDGSKVVIFTVGIACGDEVIPVKEFGVAWRARRLARKVAEYTELPIHDRAR